MLNSIEASCWTVQVQNLAGRWQKAWARAAEHRSRHPVPQTCEGSRICALILPVAWQTYPSQAGEPHITKNSSQHWHRQAARESAQLRTEGERKPSIDAEIEAQLVAARGFVVSHDEEF